jgi:putative sterol carrier protein
MGLKFGTEEWVQAYTERLNANPAYEQAAKTWEGAFIFVVKPEGALDHELRFYVDLYHGKARDWHVVTDLNEKAPFIFEGGWNNWNLLLQKKLDPIQGLMQGKFKLVGDMAKVMRAVRAAQELVNTVLMIDTELYS